MKHSRRFLAVSAFVVAGLGSACGPSGGGTFCEGSSDIHPLYHFGCDRHDVCGSSGVRCWDRATPAVRKSFQNGESFVVQHLGDGERNPQPQHSFSIPVEDLSWTVQADGSGTYREAQASCSTTAETFDPIARIRNNRLELRTDRNNWRDVTRILGASSGECKPLNAPVASFNGAWVAPESAGNAPGDPSLFQGRAVTETPDGVVAVGSWDNGGATGAATKKDALLYEYDASGKRQWQEQISTPKGEVLHSVAAGGSGTIYAAGQVHERDYQDVPTYPDTDGLLVRLNASGSIEWKRRFGITGTPDAARAVDVSTTGAIFVVGYTDGSFGGANDPHGGSRDPFVAKYSPGGTLEWTKIFGASGAKSRGCGVGVADGRIFAAASSFDSSGAGTGRGDTRDVHVTAFTPDGNREWDVHRDTPSTADCADLAVGDDRVYAAGTISTTDRNKFDGAFVSAFDRTGAFAWTEQFDHLVRGEGKAVAVDGSGTVVVAGSSISNSKNPDGEKRAGFITELSAAGSRKRTRFVDTLYRDSISGATTSGPTILVTGRSNGRWKATSPRTIPARMFTGAFK